jgi:hypothetical protein
MSLSGFTASPNTGATMSAQAPNAVRKMWDRGVELFEQTSDFFRQFEGKSASNLIHSKTDTSKGKGQEIEFTVTAGLYGRAHLGDQLFADGTHFEKLKLASNRLKVDWFRHAVRYTERTEEVLGMRGELVAGIPEQLGNWLGRLKTKHMFMSLLHKGDSRNMRVINNRASINQLLPGDTLDYDTLISTGAQLQTTSGRPAYVGKDVGGNPIHKYVIVSTSDALLSLEYDPDYKAAKGNSGERGDMNLIFKGGYHNLRGHIIKEYTSLDHDGNGPIGSPINPKAELGVAITAGTAAFAIKGGGYAEAASLTRVDYFEDFPNWAFAFAEDDVLDVSESDEYYVIIFNREGEDAGKWGMYAYTANSGSDLTITKRLGATGGGTRHPRVGNVVWNAAKNTDVHPEGSLVILCSENGAPVGYSITMGASAARRGYGKYARHRGVQEHEAGFIRDIHIRSVFGQAPRRDARGRAPGYSVLAHAIQYPGINIDPTLFGA